MSKCVVYEAETSTMFQRCGGCGGRNSNFPYRKLFTPDLNVFPLYKSYYFFLHFLHHLPQKGSYDSCKRNCISLTSNSRFLEQFKLLAWRIRDLWLIAIKQLYVSKLFVCYANYPNFPISWQKRFHSFFMNLCILQTCTMTNINRELKHGKSIP